MNLYVGDGNLVKDPELRETNTGAKVVEFRLAVSSVQKSKSGSKNEEVAYIECEAWDSAAEYIADNFAKGNGMTVEGRFRTDSWETKDGQKRSRLKLRVRSFTKRWPKPRDEEAETGEDEVGF